MEIQFQSDIGKRRNMNQDYANVFTNQAGMYLAILADGMGGHLAGDVASKMAVDGLGAAWSTSTIEQPEEAAKWFSAEFKMSMKRSIKKGLLILKCKEWEQQSSVQPCWMKNLYWLMSVTVEPI